MKVLSTVLSNYFFTNFATIEFISLIIEAIIKVRDVNLSKLSVAIDLKIKQESIYRKLQRFFLSFDFTQELFAKMMIRLFNLESDSWFLALDRTNWQFGNSDINILMLSVCYQGVSIPIMWNILDKKGASNFEERKLLLEKFIKVFGVNKINGLLADREFIGHEWFKWLNDNSVIFYIRIREDLIIGCYGNELMTVNHFLKSLEAGVVCNMLNKRSLGRGHRSQKVKISASKNTKGELMIVATNSCNGEAINIYKKRWEIETLFGFLKTKGFNFESTHMKEGKKINTMLALLSISFAICYKTGLKKERSGVKVKTKKNGVKRFSAFKIGLNHIQKLLFKCEQYIEKFLILFRHILTLFHPKFNLSYSGNLFVVY